MVFNLNFMETILIKKVIFISDHYRSRQERNVKILFGLISPVFLDLDIKVEILSDTAQYLDKEKWADSLDEAGTSVLADHDLGDAAVVGFEINPLDKSFLSDKNIPWINVEIHPIRFLGDLYFSVTASFPFGFDLLSCSEKQIHLAANALKLKNLDLEYGIGENVLVIIGQTPADKSIYFDSEFKSLLNYIDTLEVLCSQHDTIYYRPHPVESDPKIDEEIVKKFNAPILSDMSYYDLLSADQVQTICAISSSSLHEAKYFHKDVVFLEERVKEFSKPISLKSLLECNELWFDGLLSIDSKKLKREKFEFPENFCRDIFGYWSYRTSFDEIRSEIQDIRDIITVAKAKADEAHSALTSTSWKITEPLREFKTFMQKK